ncbi:putative Peptidase A1 domain-containing protein [Seiridium unicorne]|uniref:Peptidase A1 domain-containing protein n=1 Tax=Seiridium unicorne TaxID=138068 RepID=A0ABR2UYS2_9PEZI
MEVAGIKKIYFNVTVTQLAGEWFVDSPEFYIDGKVVENSSSGSPFPGSQSLVDTFTAYIQTPDYQTALDIYAAISPEIVQIDKVGAWGAPCVTMERLQPGVFHRIS